MQALEQQFGRLFQQYRDRVYHTAFYVVKDPHLAQDVTQETFLKAYRHLHSIKQDGKEGAWLTTIATHAAIDAIRKRKCWNGVPMEHLALAESGGATAVCALEDEVSARLETERVIAQIGTMKKEYRDVLRLKLYSGLKDGEIAGLLNVSIGTIKSRIHRAKRLLRTMHINN